MYTSDVKIQFKGRDRIFTTLQATIIQTMIDMVNERDFDTEPYIYVKYGGVAMTVSMYTEEPYELVELAIDELMEQEVVELHPEDTDYIYVNPEFEYEFIKQTKYI